MLNYYKDFTKGERDYLKGQEMTEERFNKLDEVGRTEWKEECKSMTLESNWTKRIAKNHLIIKVSIKQDAEWIKKYEKWADKIVFWEKIFFWRKEVIDTSKPFHNRSIWENQLYFERLIPFLKDIKKIKQEIIKPTLRRLSSKLAEMAQ